MLNLLQVRKALKRAEKELEKRQQSPTVGPDLVSWLQYTYELENKHYELKKENAERQLIEAKDMV